MTVPIRDWLTAVEVSDLFGVTPQTVRWWILTGKLSGELASKNTYLIHTSAVEQFREQRHAANTPSAARRGETSNRPSVRSSIDPNKRYKIKGTGEIVTGAELLRKRGQA